jgi:hypothetical protein
MRRRRLAAEEARILAREGAAFTSGGEDPRLAAPCSGRKPEFLHQLVRIASGMEPGRALRADASERGLAFRRRNRYSVGLRRLPRRSPRVEVREGDAHGSGRRAGFVACVDANLGRSAPIRSAVAVRHNGQWRNDPLRAAAIHVLPIRPGAPALQGADTWKLDGRPEIRSTIGTKAPPLCCEGTMQIEWAATVSL